jgi:predicted nucleic acid-binding protein
VWSLRHYFTAHDAIYVALAEALNAQFLTRNERLATANRRYLDIELA